MKIYTTYIFILFSICKIGTGSEIKPEIEIISIFPDGIDPRNGRNVTYNETFDDYGPPLDKNIDINDHVKVNNIVLVDIGEKNLHIGWDHGPYTNFILRIYREFGNYEEELVGKLKVHT